MPKIGCCTRYLVSDDQKKQRDGWRGCSNSLAIRIYTPVCEDVKALIFGGDVVRLAVSPPYLHETSDYSGLGKINWIPRYSGPQ